MTWRTPAVVAVLAFLAWVGFEIGRAGSDIQVARVPTADKMFHGSVHGKRIDQRAWSLDFDTVTLSPDGLNATIAHVRDGRIHRVNKPDVLMKADYRDGQHADQRPRDRRPGDVHRRGRSGPHAHVRDDRRTLQRGGAIARHRSHRDDHRGDRAHRRRTRDA